MITSILLIVVVAALSVAVAGVVLSQTRPTQAIRKDVGTLNAAQSGFEVTLHRLRAANDASSQNSPSSNGMLSKLPCTMTDKNVGTLLTGSVGPNQGGFSYTVAVRYYYADPTTYAGTATATNTAWLRDNTIGCNGSAPSGVPQYALLQANGNGTDVPGSTVDQGDRNLHTTYQFKTTNVNIAGGRLGENTTSLCMDAGTSPAVGSAVYTKTCGARGALASQSWDYRPDLSIHYVASGDPGLCVTGGANASGTALTLNTCQKPSTNYPYVSTAAQQQEFSFDDNGKFEGAANNGGINGLCIAPASSLPSSGDSLFMGSCGSGYNTATWNPDKQTGAGRAGDAASQQLVNYAEFGRCLDVTNQDPNHAFLITYPCKQAPDPTQVAWNQRWVVGSDSAGRSTLGTSTGGTNYCLVSPGLISTSNTSLNRVVIKPCDSSVAQRWTKTAAITGNYTASYQVLDNAGLCMSLGTPDQGDAYIAQFSTIIVEPCDGSLKQKWNAPANLVDSQVKGTVEEQGGT